MSSVYPGIEPLRHEWGLLPDFFTWEDLACILTANAKQQRTTECLEEAEQGLLPPSPKTLR